MNAVLNNIDHFEDTFLKRVFKILFPIKCIGCSEINKHYICDRCLDRVTPIKPECFVTREESINWDINSKDTAFEKVYYFYLYDKLIHNLMLDIKYRFHKDKLSTVASLIYNSKEFQKLSFDKIDLITFVPISKKRMGWRGFNQSQELSRYISKFLNRPFSQLLIKTKNTKPQIELTREERLENLKSTFKIKENIPVTLSNQSILLVDDICTTGSTLEECAKTFKSKCPGLKIYGMCLARGENQRSW
jgi:ComF family protein